MAAEIIEFPERRAEDRLVSSVARLEAIVREIERVAADDPEAGLDRLLGAMERMGQQLVDLADLLLDQATRLQAQSTFQSLSDKIAETRDRFERRDGGSSV